MRRIAGECTDVAVAFALATAPRITCDRDGAADDGVELRHFREATSSDQRLPRDKLVASSILSGGIRHGSSFLKPPRNLGVGTKTVMPRRSASARSGRCGESGLTLMAVALFHGSMSRSRAATTSAPAKFRMRPFLEGGDTFVLGKDILVGFSSLGSSPAGAAWYLEPDGYRVHLVPLTAEWLHLDCMFAVVREGLCMCFMQGLKEGRLPVPIKDWEVIEATAGEARTLGCNTICLEPGAVLIGAEHKRLIAEIEKRGVSVVAIPFDKPSELGGGIRCSTHPLLREP